MVGFSCHDGQLSKYLKAAAEGGFVDIIMMAYHPFFTKGDEFDQALEACYNKGIALVAMKTMRSTGDVPKRLPEFDKMGLTTHQAILHAVWSDPRISSICNMIDNVSMMESSTAAARKYTAPLKTAQIELLRETGPGIASELLSGLSFLRCVRGGIGVCGQRRGSFCELLRA